MNLALSRGAKLTDKLLFVHRYAPVQAEQIAVGIVQEDRAQAPFSMLFHLSELHSFRSQAIAKLFECLDVAGLIRKSGAYYASD